MPGGCSAAGTVQECLYEEGLIVNIDDKSGCSGSSAPTGAAHTAARSRPIMPAPTVIVQSVRTPAVPSAAAAPTVIAQLPVNEAEKTYMLNEAEKTYEQNEAERRDPLLRLIELQRMASSMAGCLVCLERVQWIEEQFGEHIDGEGLAAAFDAGYLDGDCQSRVPGVVRDDSSWDGGSISEQGSGEEGGDNSMDGDSHSEDFDWENEIHASRNR